MRDRDSNFELLRIIAMIMIIAHHFSVHGGFCFSDEHLTVNRLWINYLSIGGKLGEDLFVLISGYFLVYKDKGHIARLFILWITLCFYSVIMYVVFTLAGQTDSFSVKSFVKCFLPVSRSEWWFASTYFVMVLFVPFYNKFLRELKQKEYIKFIILGGVCWCVIPTVLFSSFEGNNLIWFLYLYAVAGYLRLWQDNISFKLSPKVSFGLAGLLFIGLCLITVLIDWAKERFTWFFLEPSFFYGQNQIPIFAMALLLFIGIKDTKIKYSKMVNTIGGATFGVYLIHDNHFVRPWLWNNVFHNAEYGESIWLIPYSILVILLVFIVCALVEVVRKRFVERLYILCIQNWSEKLGSRLEGLFGGHC